MFKKLALKGFSFGITVGLIVTIFDGLFMLTKNIYVPSDYPILLIFFNTIFWMFFGGVSGFFLWIFMRNRKDLLEKENIYWVTFFLLPFSIMYGLLGRISIPSSNFTSTSPPTFDHDLSFIWVMLILLFLVISKKRVTEGKAVTISFIPEVSVFCLIFQFCSNLLHIQTITTVCFNYFIKNILNVGLVQYLNIVYIFGTLLLIAFYFIIFYASRYLRKGVLSWSKYSINAILLIIAIFCLTGFYAWNNISHTKQELPFNGAEKNLKVKKVPHIILIVLDTVRADHLSIYSSNHVFTKNLEEFSQDALVFENCVATSSWTIPSHASLFTGLYPSEHGSHGNLDSKTKWFDNFPPTVPLSEEALTLAEIFKDNGYQTVAAISNYAFLHKGFNLDQGFQIYDTIRSIGVIYSLAPFHPIVHLFCHLTNISPKYILPYRTADEITNSSLRLIDKLKSGAFFLFTNYMDAHAPYHPPSPFHGYFVEKTFPHLYRLEHYLRRFILKQWNEKDWIAYQRSQYDGEIAYLDNSLGKLFSQLKNIGMYDSSLIIVTSDHGELFGSHGFYGHRTLMYEGLIKVPLIIKFPFSKRVGSEKKNFSLADLFPTILSICDLPIPEDISGKAFWEDSLSIVSEFYNYGIGNHQALYDGKYKYMSYQHQREPELYDLGRDPKEKDNLVNVLQEVTPKMKAKLREWEMTHAKKFKDSEKGEGKLSKEIWEGLKALGYIH